MLRTDNGNRVALVSRCYSGPGVRHVRSQRAREINHYLEDSGQESFAYATTIPVVDLIFLALIFFGVIRWLIDVVKEEGKTPEKTAPVDRTNGE